MGRSHKGASMALANGALGHAEQIRGGYAGSPGVRLAQPPSVRL